MKTLLSITSFLTSGILLFSACSEENMGKSPKRITEKIEADVKEISQDTVVPEPVIVEEPVAPIPPPPPSPVPSPGPDPWPDPEPIIVEPPMPFPEPVQIPDSNRVVDFPDVAAVFPGDKPTDTKNLMKFISDHLRYPQIDKEMETEGRVYIEFIVEKDGSLSNFKVLRGVSKSLDKEALRVMRLMPKWVPAELNGDIVRCRARLPITFKLN